MSFTFSATLTKYPENWRASLIDAQAKLLPKQYNQLQLLFAAAVGDTNLIDQSIKEGASLDATTTTIDHPSVRLFKICTKTQIKSILNQVSLNNLGIA